MTWLHTGKIKAFEQSQLNYERAKQLNIEGFKQKDKPFTITQQALSMLQVQCGYDQTLVLQEIQAIIQYPNHPSTLYDRRNFLHRIRRAHYPFKNYHYLIEYNTANGLVIDDIYFDKRLTGTKDPFSNERTMMYHVEQRKDFTDRFDGVKTEKQLEAFQNAWEVRQPTAYAQTMHITVNGMLNELKKAAWLMGVHTQVAYAEDNVTAYTLFHNPSDGPALDLIECLYDTCWGKKSHNAMHLMSIIAQQAHKPTKWTVHSQGAIIFLTALKAYKKKHKNVLVNHQLSIHGAGANMNQIRQVAQALGVKIVGERNNPFDLVPNLAGRNNLSLGSLMRSWAFKHLVKGNNMGASPHTLPFLGIETYLGQLQELGEHKMAKRVADYIKKYCV